MLEATHGASLLSTADALDLLLGTTGGDDRQAAGQQVVAAVAVLDLNGVARRTEVVHVSSKDELHRVPPFPQRVVET